MIAWIILMFVPFWKNRDKYVVGIIIVFLSIVYAWLIFSNFTLDGLKDFNSLAGVSHLFSNKLLLLAGWVHYLAFDLLTGIYIIRRSRETGINHWLIVPALLFTFLLGPVGLLLFFLIKVIKTKNTFTLN